MPQTSIISAVLTHTNVGKGLLEYVNAMKMDVVVCGSRGMGAWKVRGVFTSYMGQTRNKTRQAVHANVQHWPSPDAGHKASSYEHGSLCFHHAACSRLWDAACQAIGHVADYIPC